MISFGRSLSKLSTLFTGVSLTLLAVAPLAGAQTAGAITGQVLDSGQRAIVGARVVAQNAATGQAREAQTDAAGHFTLPSLPIGTYKLTVEQSGFQTQARAAVQVGVAETVTADFALAPGVVTETVEVKGGEAVLDTEGTASGGKLNNRTLVELPINGRDYARFSLLQPGAVARSNFISDLSFNGLHTVHNQFAIDGIDASRVDQPYMSNGFERGARLLTGSLDTIAEFRVQGSNYQAQYGRAAGTFINIASKSGSNEFHGTAFEFFRNDALDARNFFNTKPNPQAPFRFNDFGGNLGGPIVKNRTFFFVNYEGSRQRVGITGTGTVPSQLMREQTLAASPELRPILETMPLGTSTTTNPLVDNYSTAKTSQIREDTASVKFDHRFTESNSFYARVNVNDTRVFGPLFGVTPAALGLLDFQNVPVRTSNFAINDQHIFSPRLINEFTFGMQRWASTIISDTPYPQAIITGLTIVSGTRGRTLSNNTSYQVGDTMTYTSGAHTLKFGATVWDVRIIRRSVDTSTLTFASLADFINNTASTASYTVGNPGSSTRGYQVGVFAQDTWRARPNLTIDYGLRYDYFTPPYDPTDRAQPYDTRFGVLAPPGTSYFKPNRKNFAPRLALAWQPTERLIVRTGYGVFYQAYPVGFGSYTVPLNNIPGNTTFVRQQIPDLSYPLTPFLSQGTRPLQTVSGFAWEKPDLYSQQWNLTLVFQVSQSDAVQAAYMGNHGLNLRRNLNINFFDPALGRRPNTAFSDINIETGSGQNIYHGLQLSWKRRLSRGFQFEANYTWAHAIDDVQDQGLFSAQPQDNRNWKAERGNSSGDTRHNFSFSTLYELPFGAGQRWLGGDNGAVGKLVGGWKLAALGLIRSGVATTVFIGTNTFGNGNFVNQRPNAVAGVDPYAADQTPNQWFNPAAFSLPAQGTFGNLGRNTVFGPNFRQIDISLLKDTRLTEDVTLQFRAEAFNAFNRPNFDQPNTTFGTPNFGRIFNTFGRTLGLGTSRQIQFALKLLF